MRNSEKMFIGHALCMVYGYFFLKDINPYNLLEIIIKT
jgi:hypothetical protein